MTGNFIVSKDDFTSEESENDETINVINDETIKVIPSNKSNTVHGHIYHSFTQYADRNFKRVLV